jgi:GNAT superfamily N-acetyltransferase
MNAPPKNLPVKMIRASLDGLPEFALPAGFAWRWYQPGDEAHWRRIQLAAERFVEITPQLFGNQFGVGEGSGLEPASAGERGRGINSALQILRERQCYLLDPRGEVIGTGTAWFDKDSTAGLVNAGLPLTPTLSPSDGERENRPPTQREPGTEDPSAMTGTSGEEQPLFPLPRGGGEGQGEGERAHLRARVATEFPLTPALSPSEGEREEAGSTMAFLAARSGRVHWMAILPEFQGRGLGKALLSTICHRLRELGHERAYLHTSAARIPAIKLYLKFGFEPMIRNAEERAVWKEVLAGLPRVS